MTVTAQQRQRYAQLLAQSDAIIHRSGQASVQGELLCLSQYAQDNATRDTYGQGGIARNFEAELSVLFNKPGALFLPTGTLAQCVAMKCYSEQSKRTDVALHPSSHLLLHEHNAIDTLWQLRVQTVGKPDAVISPADFYTLDESSICAVIIETPMRELGGILPDWDTLVAIRQWCDENQIAMHMDGARVWQITPFYQRSLKEIAALFDSLYVSFYKDLNGIFGAALLGSESFIEDARIWARRAGGNPITLYPEILAAQRGLKIMGNQMPQFVSYANALGQQLAGTFQVIPEIPQAAMFHLKFDTDGYTLVNKIVDYAEQTGVVVLPLPRADSGHNCTCEITIGDQATKHPPEFWTHHLKTCLGE